MKFLVDANLPPGLATWLRGHAHEAIHISDQPGLVLDDRALFEFARQHGYIIVTKDEDFAALATLADDPAPVVWLRLATPRTPRFGTGWDRLFLRSCSVLLPEKRSSKWFDAFVLTRE